MNGGQGARLTACNGGGGVAGKNKENLQIEDILNLLLKITTVPWKFISHHVFCIFSWKQETKIYTFFELVFTGCLAFS